MSATVEKWTFRSSTDNSVVVGTEDSELFPDSWFIAFHMDFASDLEE